MSGTDLTVDDRLAAALAAALPEGSPQDVDDIADETTTSSWRPVDLTTTQAAPEEPQILHRLDGLALLYPRRLHWLSGEPESNKTWIAFAGIPRVLAEGGRVLVIDYEDDAGGFIERMAALGVDTTAAARSSQLIYINPHEGLTGAGQAVTPGQIELHQVLQTSPTYAIIDGVTAGMDLEGLDPLKNDQVARWLAALAKPLVRTGAAVVCIDHVTKSKEGRDRWAIGGQHKLAAVDGAAYIVECIKPGGRATGGEPVDGLARLRLAKDRRGYIRGRCERTNLPTVADVSITSYPDGGITISIDTPGRGDIDKTQARVIEHVAIYPGSAKSALREIGNSDSVDQAVKELIALGHLVVEVKGNAHRHHLTPTGRDHWSDEIAAATGGAEE